MNFDECITPTMKNINIFSLNIFVFGHVVNEQNQYILDYSTIEKVVIKVLQQYCLRYHTSKFILSRQSSDEESFMFPPAQGFTQKLKLTMQNGSFCNKMTFNLRLHICHVLDIVLSLSLLVPFPVHLGSKNEAKCHKTFILRRALTSQKFKVSQFYANSWKMIYYMT